MKSKHAILTVLLAATICVPAVRADSKAESKIEQLFPDSVIAKGAGFEVKRSELDQVLSNVKLNATAHNQEIPPAQIPLIEAKLLDQLILMKVLVGKATDAEKASAKEVADKQLETFTKQLPTEEAQERQLKLMNLTLPEFKTKLLEEATFDSVLRSKVTVTDEEIKKFYDENPAKFEQPEMVRASHILISTVDPKTGKPLSDDDKKAKLKIIEGLLKRARDGEDFAKMAKEFSEDPGSKENGGEYTFGRGNMVPEFEAAAFSLQTNQVSDVVTTTYGYHIIKLLEKMPAHRVPLTEARGDGTVKDDVKRFLEKQAIEKMLPDYYAKVKVESKVEVLDPKLKALIDSANTPGAEPDAKPK